MRGFFIEPLLLAVCAATSPFASSGAADALPAARAAQECDRSPQHQPDPVSLEMILDSAAVAQELVGLWPTVSQFALAKLSYDPSASRFVARVTAEDLDAGLTEQIEGILEAAVRDGAPPRPLTSLLLGDENGPRLRGVMTLAECPPEPTNLAYLQGQLVQAAYDHDITDVRRTELRIRITEAGRVESVEILTGSGSNAADRSARRIMMQAKYRAARIEGIRIGIEVRQWVTIGPVN